MAWMTDEAARQIEERRIRFANGLPSYRCDACDDPNVRWHNSTKRGYGFKLCHACQMALVENLGGKIEPESLDIAIKAENYVRTQQQAGTQGEDHETA